MADRSRGCLTVDLQGPFQLSAKLINGCGNDHAFAVMELWPDVGIYLTSRKQADEIIAMLRKARGLLPADQKTADDE